MYGERILNRLDDRSALLDEGNPFRKVFVDSIGALLDEFDLVGSREAPYLQEASDVYLDLHGKDLGVKRRLDESDEHYRNRLVYETLGYLTVAYLMNVYDLTLYSYVENFSFDFNTMTSDNPYIEGQRMSVTSDESVKQILGKKFIIGDGLVWLTGSEVTDYIMIGGVNKILDYLTIYTTTNLTNYFRGKTGITSVSLSLPSANECINLFYGCTGLTSIDLSLPSATNCFGMFSSCTGLTSIDLSLPSVTLCSGLFQGCIGLTSIDLSLPSATDCIWLFYGCTGLTSIDLSLPSATDCRYMLDGCTGLTDVTLNLPTLNKYTHIFRNCSSLESINVTIPNDEVTAFKSYVLGLSLPNLTSFIINGEEVEL